MLIAFATVCGRLQVQAHGRSTWVCFCRQWPDGSQFVPYVCNAQTDLQIVDECGLLPQVLASSS